MYLMISGGTDGAMWGEPQVHDIGGQSWPEGQAIRKIVFDLLNDTVGEWEPGKLADECVNALLRAGKLPDEMAWVHSQPAGSMGECVSYWICVALVKNAETPDKDRDVKSITGAYPQTLCGISLPHRGHAWMDLMIGGGRNLYCPGVY